MKLLVAAVLAAALVLGDVPRPVSAQEVGREVDVVVYGASSGGVGAAVAAARRGMDVLLVEPSQRVGGMMTNGVTSDIRFLRSATGLFDEYRRLVLAEYESAGVPATATRFGLYSEPEVSLRAVQALLDAEERLTVRTGWWLEESPGAVMRDGSRVTGIRITDGGRTEDVQAPVVIDASPEGDVLGTAGEEGRDWVVGREGRTVHGESAAPPESDRLQQAYTYRTIFQVGGRTDYEVPETYPEDRVRFINFPRVYKPRWTCRFPAEESDLDLVEYWGIQIQRCLPNRKMDINIDMRGINHHYPTASRAERAVLEQRLRDFLIGWLHYVRTEMGYPELGLSLDDYPQNGGMPETLYVREGRRAVGEYVFTQSDAMRSPEPLPFHPTSVAVGDYGLDSHCTGPPGAISGDGDCGGGFWLATDPYQVPYGTIVPAHLDGLLVPVPLSASHVGYSTLRMEPTRMVLGYAAGTAAAIAIERGVEVRDVDVLELQRALLDARQALVHTVDLDHTAADFPTRQWAMLRIGERFDDVPYTHSHVVPIWRLTEDGTMRGRTERSFEPAGSVTRAQLASTLAVEMGLTPVTPSRFGDVRGTVHEGNIEALTRRGIISGYSDGTFRPNATVTRAQAATLLAGWLGVPPVETGPFTDVDPDSVHLGAINALHARGIISGVAADRFAPQARTSRAQMAALVHRARS